VSRECDGGNAENLYRETFLQTVNLIRDFFETGRKAGIMEPLHVAGLLYGAITQVLRTSKLAVKFHKKDLADPKLRTKVFKENQNMKPATRAFSSFLLLSASATIAATAPSITLDQYLGQVRAGNEGVRSAEETSQGALLRAREASLLFSPQLSATGQVLSDSRPQLNSFAPRKTDGVGFNLGISQQFGFGAQVRLGYQFQHVKLEVPMPQFYNTTNYYDAIPSLELSVPLLRNFGAGEARAQQSLIEASALATHYGEGFRTRMMLVEAELGYWRLAIGREIVQVQSKTLERTRFLRDWAQRRVSLNLGDKSDLLQASAAFRFRELELQSAQDEVRAATQNFNTIRGEAPNATVGGLASLSEARLDIPSSWKSSDSPPREREDLLASRQAQRLTAGQAEQVIEKNRPNLELFGQAQLNGRANDASAALSNGWSLDRRTAALGVRLVSTLNFGAKSDAQTGAEKERRAADLSLDRKVFEQRQEFLDLRSKLAEAQSRLGLARELEKIQEEKLTNERARLQRGRSTTFQLIQFETDYSAAQLVRLRSQFEVIRLVAQLNTFGASS
jgi:outer membrane protein TolC